MISDPPISILANILITDISVIQTIDTDADTDKWCPY